MVLGAYAQNEHQEASAVDTPTDAPAEEVQGETHEFQAEVNRLMDIIINNLYSDKKVFLRELISNAADAVEKARFLSVEDETYLSENPELEIKVEMDAEKKTLSIIDSGIGMTKSDLINNLGTVAKSGTTNFLEALQEGADTNLIGQFGVGFYSAFLVADRVTVTSKNNDGEQYIWESTADASFVIKEDPEGNTLGRGTKVTMHLKEDALEFTGESTIRDLIKKFSQFVQFPIYLQTRKEIEVEADDADADEDDEDDEDDEETDEDKDDDEDEDEDKEDESPKEKKKEVVYEWDLVNAQKAIWVRPKEEISDEDYNEFYKAISKSSDAPLARTHFSAEGDVEFKSLLYIPNKAAPDMMQMIATKKSEIKMYVRRVLVGEEIDELVPRYLYWVKGVVDSDDLPLNVSREQLQQSKVMKVISKKLTRKILDMLRKVADKAAEDQKEKDEDKEEDDDENKSEEDKEDEEDKKEKEEEDKKDAYLEIYEQFGEALKWGAFEDDANRGKIMKLLRFKTSHSDGKLVSLQSVLDKMPEGQKKIYYISGDDTTVMLKSPSMQMFNKKNIEVLLLDGPNDEHVISKAGDFDGKSFASVQKDGLELDDEEEKKKTKGLEKMFKDFTKWANDALTEATTNGALSKVGAKIDSVKISTRLVQSPMVVVASAYGYSPKMEALMNSQSAGSQGDIMRMMSERKIIEVNPYHPIINKLAAMTKENADDVSAKNMIATLFQTALIESGFGLQDPTAYVSEIQNIMAGAMDIADVNELVDIEIPEEVEEEDKKDDDDDENDDDEDEIVVDGDDDDAEEVDAPDAEEETVSTEEVASEDEKTEEATETETEAPAATEETETASEDNKEEL